MMRELKKYEELTIVDNFMFGKVMRDPGRCKKLLEIILKVKIRKVVLLEEEYTMNPSYLGKSIRLDILLEDDVNTIYDVEMQAENSDSVPKRSRYYQSTMDINLLEQGKNYKELRKSFIIFICVFDLFRYGLPIYHFRNLCVENPRIGLGDQTEKIFLNVKAYDKCEDEELRNLLKYFACRVPQDTYTRELEDTVMAIVDDKALKMEYMSAWARECDLRDAGREEGKIDAILLLLKNKGQVPDALIETINAVDEEAKLDEYLLLAAKVNSIEEFQNVIE